MLEKREFYIDGGWVSPKAGTDFEVIDPSTEEPFAVISLGGQALYELGPVGPLHSECLGLQDLPKSRIQPGFQRPLS